MVFLWFVSNLVGDHSRSYYASETQSERLLSNCEPTPRMAAGGGMCLASASISSPVHTQVFQLKASDHNY